MAVLITWIGIVCTAGIMPDHTINTEKLIQGLIQVQAVPVHISEFINNLQAVLHRYLFEYLYENCYHCTIKAGYGKYF